MSRYSEWSKIARIAHDLSKTRRGPAPMLPTYRPRRQGTILTRARHAFQHHHCHWEPGEAVTLWQKRDRRVVLRREGAETDPHQRLIMHMMHGRHSVASVQVARADQPGYVWNPTWRWTLDDSAYQAWAQQCQGGCHER